LPSGRATADANAWCRFIEPTHLLGTVVLFVAFLLRVIKAVLVVARAFLVYEVAPPKQREGYTMALPHMATQERLSKLITWIGRP
jgi:hypothetical protein